MKFLVTILAPCETKEDKGHESDEIKQVIIIIMMMITLF